MITKIQLEKADEREIRISIDFTVPSDISSDILEPDYLEVRFNLPQLIVDAATGEALIDQELVYWVLMEP